MKEDKQKGVKKAPSFYRIYFFAFLYCVCADVGTIYEDVKRAGEPLVFAAEGGENFPFVLKGKTKAALPLLQGLARPTHKFKRSCFLKQPLNFYLNYSAASSSAASLFSRMNA